MNCDIDKYFDDLLSSYTLTLQEDEVNLREYVILGGTAEVSLFKHIPQPLILFNKWILHTGENFRSLLRNFSHFANTYSIIILKII